MHPLLFEWFGVKIYAYGVMVALAFLAGYGVMSVQAKKNRENPDHYLEAIVWFILAGIGGARLFYFLWFPQQFFHDPVGTALSSGGLVWYGGVIGVTIAAVLYARFRKLNPLRFADVISPGAALGLAIGRIGCLLAGCCYGSFTHLPWAIHYPISHETHGLAVHPTPLYETGLMLIVMMLLIRLDTTKRFQGRTTAWFFILAGFVRFVLEYVRGDRLVWDVPVFAALNLSASQVISILGIIAGLIMLYVVPKLRASRLDAPVHTDGSDLPTTPNPTLSVP